MVIVREKYSGRTCACSAGKVGVVVGLWAVTTALVSVGLSSCASLPRPSVVSDPAGDGIENASDLCPGTRPGTGVDGDGCPQVGETIGPSIVPVYYGTDRKRTDATLKEKCVGAKERVSNDYRDRYESNYKIDNILLRE